MALFVLRAVVLCVSGFSAQVADQTLRATASSTSLGHASALQLCDGNPKVILLFALLLCLDGMGERKLADSLLASRHFDAQLANMV